ncbi:MAG: hypothetical protein L3J52_05310, partial [Proteobacteria bacterium]|nr:hypothetical protein [Pseudomonadota bacterium]
AVKIAKLDLLQGKHDQVLQDLLKLEGQYPEDIELKLYLGITRLETGETGFAELYFNKILEEKPDQVVAKAYLAISLVRSDQKKAIEIINELSSLHPNAAEVQIAFGMYYHAIGSHQKAIKHLYVASQTELAYPSWILTLAHSLSSIKQNDQAITILNVLIQRTNLASAQAALGMIYHGQNDFDKALMAYSQISSDYKEINTVLTKKAECLYHLKQFEKCIETIDVVLNDKDYYVDALKVKLHALAQLKQHQVAINLINTQKDSNNSKDFNNLLQFYAGLLCDANKDYQSAWGYFKNIQHQATPNLTRITEDHAATVKNWQKPDSKEGEPKPVFILSDPATGHHDVCNWLQENSITVLLDRFGINPRKDFLNREWTIQELQGLSETEIHLLRRKYQKNLSHIRMERNRTMVDILPFNIVSAVIIKRIYPDAHIVMLSRNSADIKLHQKIFGVGLVDVEAFKTMQNQMIAIGLNPIIIDIDQFKANKQAIKSEFNKVLGVKTSEFKAIETTALETTMMPYMHWRNYQELMN